MNGVRNSIYVLGIVLLLLAGCVQQPQPGNETVNASGPSQEKIDKIKEGFEIIAKLQGLEGVTVQYNGYVEKDMFYLLNFTLSNGMPAPPVILVKDSDYFFIGQLSTVDQFYEQMKQVEQQMKNQSNQQNNSQQGANTLPKTEKPKVELFVMSYCPFGTQMEKAILPVVELLGEKADIEVKFVHYTMHGAKEVIENTRQHCIKSNYSEKYWEYLKCFLNNTDAENCMEQVGINSSVIDECINATHEAYNINVNATGYPTYPIYENESKAYGVRGSPTLVINGMQVSVTRSPEAIKEKICEAFITPPEECNQTLSTTPESPGFGFGSSGGGGGSATCG